MQIDCVSPFHELNLSIHTNLFSSVLLMNLRLLVFITLAIILNDYHCSGNFQSVKDASKHPSERKKTFCLIVLVDPLFKIYNPSSFSDCLDEHMSKR